MLQPPSDERFYRNVHLLVQAGSLSAAYQRLTQPGHCPHDPLSRFLEIHRDVDLSTCNLHPDSIKKSVTILTGTISLPLVTYSC